MSKKKIISIRELFENQTKKNPDNKAIVCGDTYYTYQKLNLKSNQLAHHLIDIGIKTNDRVAICCERSLLLVVALLAIQKAGGTYVPLDPEYPNERLNFMLEDCEARILLCQEGLQNKFKNSEQNGNAEQITIDNHSSIFYSNLVSNPPTITNENDYLYTIYTSGSTGLPKGSLVYHKGACNLLNWYCKELNFNESSKPLLMTSYSFDLTQKNIYAPLISGGCLFLLETQHYDANIILNTINNQNITSINCTPSAFYGLVADTSPEKLKMLKSLKYVVMGGEPILVPRFIDWIKSDYFHAKIINSYGPTECSDVVSSYTLHDFGQYLNSSVPIGKPIDNTELFIMDAKLREVPQGGNGELCISGAGVGGGYLNRPDYTTERFCPHPLDHQKIVYRTGDRARLMDDGNIEYLGRIDQQVKVRGFRIELGEIEAKLESLDSVREAVVLAKADNAGDNRLVAYLVPKFRKSQPAISEIRTQLQQNLPDFMLPTAWVFIEKMPLSPNGKLDRNALPDPGQKRPELSQPYLPAATPIEKFLVQSWKQLLNLDQVGVKDRFFELGGTSIRAIQFIAQLGKHLGEPIPIASFFAAPTIEGFIQILETNHLSALQKYFPDHHLQSNSSRRRPQTKHTTNINSIVDDIAIIGFSGRFPGADDVDSFWTNLRNGIESVEFASDDHLRLEGVSESQISDADYCKAYFSANDLDGFDADFFGYQPREIELMDPQHRLFLELAWIALDNAGYADTASHQHQIGVFGGIARDSYLHNFLCRHPQYKNELGNFNINMGNDKNFPVTRTAYKLNLTGPAINIQTACSSSGIALHLACQSIKLGECDMALVGGCRVISPSEIGYLHVEGGPLSVDGHLRAFDAKASGMVRGSGGAILVIKRLEAARSDGDCIRGIIKSTAINNDGDDKIGFTAPSVAGQEEVIYNALERAEVNPESIDFVETHGTATMLGDPIEVTALTNAYRRYTDKNGYCRLGSVKTNVGHLDAGSTSTSIIKTLLAMEHAEIPPSLNYLTPNPNIDFANSPFIVANKLTPWECTGEKPRRAAVSAFGLGGTNFHTILEQAEQLQENETTQNRRPWQICTLSAKSAISLNANLAGLARYRDQLPDQTIDNLAFSLNNFRPDFSHRTTFLCKGAKQLGDIEFLKVEHNVIANSAERIMFYFPSEFQLPQRKIIDLLDSEVQLYPYIDECCSIIQAGIKFSTNEKRCQFLLDIPTSEQSFIIQYALARLWIGWGVAPTIIYGSGLGKICASCIAGVLSLNEAYKLLQSVTQDSLNSLEKMLLQLKINLPDLPLLTDQKSLPASCDILSSPEFWSLRETDHGFSKSIHDFLDQQKVTTVLQISPDPLQKCTSSGKQKKPAGNLQVIVPLSQDISDPAEGITAAIGKLWLKNISIDWNSYYSSYLHHKIPLPPFQFNRRRYWLELPDMGAKIITFSASSETTLNESAVQWAEYLKMNPDCNLEKLTSPERPLNQQHQIGIVAFDNQHAAKILAANSVQTINRRHLRNDPAAIAFMFPGGGAQYLQMGKGLYRRYANFRNSIDEGLALFGARTGYDLKRVWFAATHELGWANREMNKPSIQLPAIFILEMALAKLWMSWGLQPSALIGHSLGENCAACLSEVLSYEETLGLVILRGQLFEKIESGAMLSVNLSSGKLANYIEDQIDIAIINGPEQCSVSGPRQQLEALHVKFEEADIESQMIPIATAAHSRLLEPVLDEFKEYLHQVKLKPPKIQMISNLTGDWLSDHDAIDPEYWVNHLRSTVQFSSGLQTLTQQEFLFLEVGPGKGLCSLLKSQYPKKSHAAIASLRHGQEQVEDQLFFLNSLCRLLLNGAQFDQSKIILELPGTLIHLPTQPPGSHPVSINQNSPLSVAIPIASEAVNQSGSTIIMCRKTLIVEKIKSIIEELSGISRSNIDTETTFLNMGFDSLFLTQTNLKLKKAFKIKISLRQVLGDAPTITALSEYIDQQLPEEALADELQTQSQSQPQTTISQAEYIPGTNMPAVNTQPADLQQAIALHIQTSSALLSYLQGGITTQPQIPPPIHPPVAIVQQESGAAESQESAPTSHGPFTPIRKSVSGDLSEQQKNYLTDFIRKYEKKTAASKALATELRLDYADPRTVMGFKNLWKELTYTLVGKRSKGSRVWDIDGNEYIDCMGGFGAILLGHAPEFVLDAVRKQLETSIDYGPQSEAAGRVARLIREFTHMDRVSFCNTGSEATLAAMRIARTVTGNDLIVTFQGDYHGIFDEILVRSQTIGDESRNQPIAPGIPASASQNILMLEYGGKESLDIIRKRGDEIAGVIVEPIQSRHPELQPREFLHKLRDLTTELDIPLIFDEIITGFRLHPQGAQGWYGIKADLACYGKVAGGGFPIGIIAGKNIYMDALDGGPWNFGDDSFPEAGVTYFAGTFIRHPVALAATEAVLLKLKEEGPQLQQKLNKKTAMFAETVNRRYRQLGVPIELVYFGSAFFIRYHGDSEFEGLFGHHLRHFGAHHIWGNRPGFLTTAHSAEDLEKLVESFEHAAVAMQKGGFLPTFEEHKEEFHPWTSVQSEIWLAGQMDTRAAAAYNEQVMFEIENQIDPAVLELVLDRVTNRHPSLRSVAAPSGDGLLVKTYMAPQLEYLDYSKVDEKQQWSEVLKRVQQNIDKPFNFQNGPLLRAILIKLAVNKFILCVSVSHLICDGWSLEIVMEDIAGFYTAISQSRHFSSRPVPALSDFLKTVEEKKDSDEYKEAKDYWLSIYKESLPPDLDLPLDHPRPKDRSYKGERHGFYLDQKLCEPMRTFAQQNGCTSFVLLLAVYLLLLERLSGQKDIVIGIPAAGQPDLGMTDSVAHAVSLLPVRFRIDNEQSIIDFLHHVRDNFMDAKDNQSFSYGELLKSLPIPRNLDRQPLLTVSFNVDMAFNPLIFDDVLAHFVPAPRGLSKVDLLFTLTDEGEQVLIEVDRNTDIIEAETIKRWVDYYQALLREIIHDPDRKISQVAFISNEDRRLLFEEWNQPLRPLTNEGNFLPLFSQQVAANPDKTAVIFADRSLTYCQLDKNSNQFANYLIEKGVHRGDLVGISVDRSEQMLVALLGILKAGAGYLPLDPQYPSERLSFMIQDAGINTLVTESDHLHKFETLNLKFVVLDRDAVNLAAASKKETKIKIDPEDTTYVIYTSGSTGQPKGVIVPHRCVVNLLCALQQRPGIGTDDIFLTVISISFDPSVIDLFLPLISGATLHIASYEQCTSGMHLRHLLQQSNASIMNATPTTWHFLLATGWHPGGRFKALCGGEVLPTELASELAGKVTELWNMYGPTEATVAACGYLVPKTGEPILIGKPFNNTHLYVLDENAQPLPPEVPGELHIGGYGVAKGYLNRDQLTVEQFIEAEFAPVHGERLYKTGDIVRFKADGNLEFLGRNDNQVKIRGLRIELGEIEACLSSHPAVEQAVVLVREDRIDDKRLVAYLIMDQEDTENETLLRSYVQSHLPDYMMPQHFVFLDSIPVSANGKVDHQALPAPKMSGTGILDEFINPKPGLEEKIAIVFAEILNLDRISATTSFFEIGGHSLLGIRALAILNSQFDVIINLKTLFSKPSVQKLAKHIEDELVKNVKPAVKLIVPKHSGNTPIPATSQQSRLWYLGQLEPTYLVAQTNFDAFSMIGNLNTKAIQKAFDIILARHSTLRTNVEMGDSFLVQKISSDFRCDLTPYPLEHYGVSTTEELIEKYKIIAQKILNVGSDPLFVAELAKVSEKEHILMVIINHLVFDGWSYDLLFEEIRKIYNAINTGIEPELPELTVQYSDYAFWQQDWLKSDHVKNQLAYWTEKFSGTLPLLNLPADYKRPTFQVYEAGEVRFEFGYDLVQHLEEIAKEHDTTLFTIIFAVYGMLMHRFTRQDDFIIGMPISGRDAGNVNDLIGFFVNTLLFRFNVDENVTFIEWLKEVKTICLEVYEHQDTPFELIAQKINPPRDHSRSPIFQTFFIYQDARSRNFDFDGIKFKSFDTTRTAGQTDLDIWLKREIRGLWGGLIYPKSLFKESTVVKFADTFVRLAETVCANPNLRIADLVAADQQEIAQITQWNNTEKNQPEETLVDHLNFYLSEFADRNAVIFAEKEVTYAELERSSNRLARYLQNNGVASGSLVGICLNRSDEMLVAVLAIWKAGGAYVPLDPDYPENRLQYMMETAELSVIVTESELEDIAEDYECRRICVDTEANQISSVIATPLPKIAQPDDLAYVIFTSGSTGKPKGVMLQHHSVLNFLHSMAREPGMKSTDRLLAVTTLSFDIHVLELYLPLFLGATVVIAGQEDTSDGQKLIALLNKNDVNIMQATPSTWRLLLTEGWTGGDSFKVLCGGEAFPHDLAQTLFKQAGELWNMYGPTETTVWSTCFKIKDPQQQILIGHPIDNTQCYVLDENLRQVPIGISGELYIGGEGVSSGYIGRPELTAERFITDPFNNKPEAKMYRTGDLVRWRTNGELEYFQRIDNQVKVRGYRIELGEVEAVLSSFQSVSHAVVSVWSKSDLDQRLVAYIIAEDPDEFDQLLLRKHLRSQLPEYMIPQHFKIVTEFPQTPNGKIDRKSLPEPVDMDNTPLSEEHNPPSTEIEIQLAEIWKELIGIETVGVYDNFFDLGGHSLLSMQLIAKAREKIGVQLTPRLILLNNLGQIAHECSIASK